MIKAIGTSPTAVSPAPNPTPTPEPIRVTLDTLSELIEVGQELVELPGELLRARKQIMPRGLSIGIFKGAMVTYFRRLESELNPERIPFCKGQPRHFLVENCPKPFQVMRAMDLLCEAHDRIIELWGLQSMATGPVNIIMGTGHYNEVGSSEKALKKPKNWPPKIPATVIGLVEQAISTLKRIQAAVPTPNEPSTSHQGRKPIDIQVVLRNFRTSRSRIYRDIHAGKLTDCRPENGKRPGSRLVLDLVEVSRQYTQNTPSISQS